jgi:hypothetical protein
VDKRTRTIQTKSDPSNAGTKHLVIPGAVATQVVQALINGTQELDKKLREQQQMPPAGNA